jgi:undecaprenyl-diphosphatase
MDYFQAVILSIVEGVSEFLPISSTGHLVLTANLLGISHSDFVKSFQIFIQLGAILGVVVLYWERLISGFKLWKKLFVALIPTLVVGLLLYGFIKNVLIGNELVTVLALGIGGVAIIGLEYYYSKKIRHYEKDIDGMSLKNAFLIGLGQSVSVIPGVSRAAATIFSGMMTGLSRAAAVEFSFLLAVPTMMAATGLDLVKSGSSFTSNEIGILAIGFIGSFVTSIFVIKWLVKFVSQNNFIGFGVYRILLAFVYWIMIVR